MHPRIREVLDVLDSSRATLEQALADAPPGVWALKPADDRWSIAEILEHLAIVEGRVLDLADEQLAPDRLAVLARETDSSSVAATMDTAGLADRTKRLSAREPSLPRAGISAETSWRTLVDRRRRLKERVAAADGLALGAITMPHARLGTLNLYQWVVFLGSHEARHVAQIRETAAVLSGA